MTMHKVFWKLRGKSRGQYALLGFCIFLSVLLLSSFSLMYFGPTVQEFLPEGGDTRKMAGLLLAVTAAGCFLFTMYASSLFFRNKSREYGIFMALGTPKKMLRAMLFRELSAVTAASGLAGLACALPLSFAIWKLFELSVISNQQMTYRFGAAGFVPGILFGMVLAVSLGIAGGKFIRRSDIMEILRAGQKSEMVREIGAWTFPAGIILTVSGILIGSGLPQLAANVLDVNLPSAFSLTYLLSLAGIYLVLLSIVAQSRAKRNKKKYYENLVSISLMRFTAKAATRNMCVIALLLFSCCFSAFYGMQYAMPPEMLNEESGRTFSMHYPLKESQAGLEEIRSTAQKYQLELVDFMENDMANLVISYNHRDFNEEGTRYLDLYSDKEKSALFMKQSDYNRFCYQDIRVEPGTYKTVLQPDFHEFFDFADGLKEVMNPDTKESWQLEFGGTLENHTLSQISRPFLYVLDDAGYETMTDGLDAEYKEHMVSFHVSDVESSYAFAKDLLGQYVSRCSSLSDHMAGWNIWEQKCADAAGEEYGYSGSVNLSMDNNMLLDDWKFAPQFHILTVQDRMQLISVYVMLSVYIFIISISAVSVMSYVRSISVAEDNRALFESLAKLGADKTYQRTVLKKQLAKIFKYPAAAGCGLGFLFSVVMDYFNDGKIVRTEIQALGMLVVTIAAVLAVLYAVYRYAQKRAEKIAGIL